MARGSAPSPKRRRPRGALAGLLGDQIRLGAVSWQLEAVALLPAWFQGRGRGKGFEFDFLHLDAPVCAYCVKPLERACLMRSDRGEDQVVCAACCARRLGGAAETVTAWSKASRQKLERQQRVREEALRRHAAAPAEERTPRPLPDGCFDGYDRATYRRLRERELGGSRLLDEFSGRLRKEPAALLSARQLEVARDLFARESERREQEARQPEPQPAPPLAPGTPLAGVPVTLLHASVKQTPYGSALGAMLLSADGHKLYYQTTAGTKMAQLLQSLPRNAELVLEKGQVKGQSGDRMVTFVGRAKLVPAAQAEQPSV